MFGQLSFGDWYEPEPGQYVSNLCGGSRALADGGEPALGAMTTPRPPSGGDGPDSSPSTASVALGTAGLLMLLGAGVTIVRTRRRSTA